MTTPRVAAIHDLSGFGRCSLTIVMPTLSAMGVQCCPLPTAYLSTHTGGFTGNTFLDMTEAMEDAAGHWAELGIHFQAIYSGFMASRRQLEGAAGLIRSLRQADTLVLVDPVMGDNGRAYRTYTPEMCAAAGVLAAEADVITPNLTEAALLLGISYEEALAADPAELVRRLSMAGRRSVVLTGVSRREGVTGAACLDRRDGAVSFAEAERVPGSFHGTGDLFASVLTGGLLRGLPLGEAAGRAAGFVSACVRRTLELGTPAREGVDFEPLLKMLF